MATDPRKRQKKLEHRAAKRKAKKHQFIREQQTGLGERLTAAATYPILHTWVTEDLWTQGLGWVLVSRELPDRSIAFAVFLVDRYCLGVKNAMMDITNRSRYENEIVHKMRSTFTSRAVTPPTARKLVEAAVEYARRLGFPPHEDYHKAKLLFGTIDAGESTEEFEFGKDGKPFFISGPNDTPERSRQIVNVLTRSCGPGGFEYLVQVGGSHRILADDSIRGPAGIIGEEEDEDSDDFTDDADEEG